MEDTSYLDELDIIHPEEIASRICGTDLHAAISNGDLGPDYPNLKQCIEKKSWLSLLLSSSHLNSDNHL